MSWRIAVASLDGITVSDHFGRAKVFYIIDVFPDGTGKLAEKRAVAPLCQGGTHEEGGLAASIASLSDCAAVLVSRIGPQARRALELAHMSVFEEPDYIERAVQKLAAYFARTKTHASGGSKDNG